MPDFDQLARRYIDSWNETDPTARRAAVEDLWGDGARYTDPLASVEGRDEIDATIATVQGQLPGLPRCGACSPCGNRRRRRGPTASFRCTPLP